jgi:periplasmic divalent cation tolerance protein
MQTNFVYITAGSVDEAGKIAEVLISERLAACANIIERMHSMYWWEGKVQKDEETILIVKTKESLIENVIARVKALHSYDVPCIVSLPVSNGYQPFLNWVVNETK